MVRPTRIAEVETVDVLKRGAVSGTFSDPAEDFNDFSVTSTVDHADWILSSEGFSGARFHESARGYSYRQYHLTATSALAYQIPSPGQVRPRSENFSVTIPANE